MNSVFFCNLISCSSRNSIALYSPPGENKMASHTFFQFNEIISLFFGLSCLIIIFAKKIIYLGVGEQRKDILELFASTSVKKC